MMREVSVYGRDVPGGDPLDVVVAKRERSNEPEDVLIPLELLEPPPTTNGNGHRKPQPELEAPKAAPHDEQAETSLLGAMMLSPDAVDVARQTLASPGDFYRPAHGHLYAALLALHDQQRPTDAVTIADHLRTHGQLDLVGGTPHLAEIMASCPAASNAGVYAEIVARHAHARRIIHIGREAAQAATDGDLDQAQRWLEQAEHAPACVDTPAQRYRSSLLRGLQLATLPPPEPLIDGFLNLDSLALLYGRPKGGKSFVALDIALSVATGSWWHRQATTRGTVLYVMAEGAHGAALRLDAWRAHQRIHSDPEHLVVLPLATNLLDGASVAALTDIAAELDPALVIIDTLNRCMPGTDEGGADMGKAVWAMDTIRLATGACVMAVHHSGKDATRGARGHTSLLGAVDTELEVLNGGDGIVTLRTTAQRHMTEANPRRFTLLPVADSLAIADYTGRLAETDAITTAGRLCIEVLSRIATDDGISPTIWRDACVEDGITKSTFYAQVKALEELGETENVGTAKVKRWRIKPTPAEAAAAGEVTPE